MNYTLAILTHGDHACLHETVDSFTRQVSPGPACGVIVHDGTDPWQIPFGAWEIADLDPQQGFCLATEELWRQACWPDAEFVFWLEHDFRFEQKVDLHDLARVLRAEPMLAQMSLRRNQTADEVYRNRKLSRCGMFGHPLDMYEQHVDYAAQSIYFTTNPSLMRSDFMRSNPWLADAEGCEGRMTIGLREKGFRFGVWGELATPQPWVTHIGERTGFGY